MLLVQYQEVLHFAYRISHFSTSLGRIGVRLMAMADGAVSRARARDALDGAIRLSVLPLALAKEYPLVSPKTQNFGFLGISYVTFRALDIVFCLRDGVIAKTPHSRSIHVSVSFPNDLRVQSIVIAEMRLEKTTKPR